MIKYYDQFQKKMKIIKSYLIEFKEDSFIK